MWLAKASLIKPNKSQYCTPQCKAEQYININYMHKKQQRPGDGVIPHARDRCNPKSKCKLDQREIEDGRKRRDQKQKHSSSSARMREREEREEKEAGPCPFMGLVVPARLARQLCCARVSGATGWEPLLATLARVVGPHHHSGPCAPHALARQSGAVVPPALARPKELHLLILFFSFGYD